MGENTFLGGVETPRIAHHRSGVIVVDKPAGLATQAPPGIPSAETWLRGWQADTSAGSYLGVPHRLDRAVSGVIAFAVTPRAARQLSRQFARRQVGKRYLALVAPNEGVIPPLPGVVTEWRDHVAKVPDEPRARIVPAETDGAREAVTSMRLVASLATAAGTRLLVLLEPQTGRMHQLRIQAAARGLPIVNDQLYGAAADPAWCGGDPRADAIALHAWSIDFADPDSGEPVTVSTVPPPRWPDVTPYLA